MRVRLFGLAAGSTDAIQSIAKIMQLWATINHARRRPSMRVRKGNGNMSIIGAQRNLKEYPNAAQLKKVTAARSTPASRNHTDRVEKINKIGIPAENPRKSMAIALGCIQTLRLSLQDGISNPSRLIVVFSS